MLVRWQLPIIPKHWIGYSYVYIYTFVLREPRPVSQILLTSVDQIIGAPAFFPTVWSWIKRWFDPITVSKIFILSSSNMKSTLEQYIDPANIPKKYGGQLDFEFGMMPVLEPAIEKALHWEAPSTQGSTRTIPTGPIKWEESADGRVTAIAVGTEDGKPRKQVIASLTTNVSIKAMHGSLVTSNTPIAEAELALITSGNHTQPPDSGDADLYIGSDLPPSKTPTPPQTQSLPIRQEKEQEQVRPGASETRFEQQQDTHAAGQLADGTPAVNDHGYGDKSVTMEPGTVGQAPKDVSVLSAEELKDTLYIGQAKEVTANVYNGTTAAVGSEAGTVTGVVGGKGGKEGETEAEPKEKEQQAC